MTIRQSMIYLFDSRHVSSINSDHSKESTAIRDEHEPETHELEAQRTVIIQTLFKRIRYNKDINHQTINRWLMNIDMICRCLVQNSTEEAKLTQWNDALSSVNLTRDEMFSVALHILHDVVLQILTNTRQLRGQMDMILVSLASDYRYLFMYIMENGNQSKQ
ncbi:unnamed protein product [Rotaria sp. Silwood2]|nr:unnamed protein product [Rotaria sp. Silwood2]